MKLPPRAGLWIRACLSAAAIARNSTSPSSARETGAGNRRRHDACVCVCCAC